MQSPALSPTIAPAATPATNLSALDTATTEQDVLAQWDPTSNIHGGPEGADHAVMRSSFVMQNISQISEAMDVSGMMSSNENGEGGLRESVAGAGGTSGVSQFPLFINGIKMNGAERLPASATQNYSTLVRFMKENLDDVAMQVQCMVVLGRSSAISACNREKVFRASAVEAIIKSLRTHQQDAVAQEFGVWALTSLCMDRRLSVMVPCIYKYTYICTYT